MVLLVGGLIAVSSSVQAAPSDPPSVRTLDSIEMEGGQIFELVAENTNNDDTTSWDFDSTDSSLTFEERVSQDERTYFLRTELPSDYGEGDGFQITVTATDGAGDQDSSTTTIYLGSDGEIESAQERIVDTGDLTDTPHEDTDIDLRMDVDDHRGDYNIASVDVVKNHPGGVTMAAAEEDPGSWAAGAFNYENPGIHEVGYTITADSDAKFTVIDELEILEKAPEISTPFDSLDTEVGQRFSFEVSATDSDGEDVGFSLSFVGNELAEEETKIVDNGDNTARVWTTIEDNEDGVVFLDVEATDSQGASSEEQIQFDIGNDPDISSNSPVIVDEDVDVTLNGTVDSADISVANMKIWKNFEWQDELLMDTYESTSTSSNTWEATFNYGQPALHHPGYQVELSSGDTVTLVGDLDVQEQAPELLVPGGMRGDNGQEVAVVLESGDSDNEDLTWDISESSDVDAEVIELEDTRIWQWEIPSEDAPDQVDIDVTVTDSQGVSASDSTTVSVGEPLAEPELPEEISTGFQVVNPIVGEDLILATEVSDDTTLDGIAPEWPSDYDDTLATTVNDDGLHEAGHTFTEEGATEVGYVLEASNGGLAAVVQTLQPEVNDPPEVEAYPDQECELECTAELRGHADDPEHRPPSTMEYSWVLVSSPILDDLPEDELEIADTVNANYFVDQLGTHVFELRVTDPYGAVGVDDVTLDVVGVIDASAALTNADDEAGEYTYVMDPATTAPVKGEISVEDHNGDPVDASVEATVFYQNVGVLPGLQVNSFQLNTGADGIETFEFDKAVAGLVGGPSLTDLPGSHEIQIEVSSGGLSDSVTVPYFVNPV